jgi:hypothetical protein
MDLLHRSVALYGRFSAGERERIRKAIEERGGSVARDLTRRSDILVIGSLAVSLIECGALQTRLATARARGIPFFAERRFIGSLGDERATHPPSLPLSTALRPSGLGRHDADLLAAFDLIVLQDENCRFSDAAVIRNAGELIGQGRSRAEMIRILDTAQHAPTGRHKLVLTPAGSPALAWDDGLTTLDGQGLLPLETPHASIDEMFEEAELADAAGNRHEAARLFEMCASADAGDAIAPYNLGNIRLAQLRYEDAAAAYRRALARDPDFIEAHYNFALALEGAGKLKQAQSELEFVLSIDPAYQDAVFNLAQICLRAGDIARAKENFESYLALNPPSNWARTARKAIRYCDARLTQRANAGSANPPTSSTG